MPCMSKNQRNTSSKTQTHIARPRISRGQKFGPMARSALPIEPMLPASQNRNPAMPRTMK